MERNFVAVRGKPRAVQIHGKSASCLVLSFGIFFNSKFSLLLVTSHGELKSALWYLPRDSPAVFNAHISYLTGFNFYTQPQAECLETPVLAAVQI